MKQFLRSIWEGFLNVFTAVLSVCFVAIAILLPLNVVALLVWIFVRLIGG